MSNLETGQVSFMYCKCNPLYVTALTRECQSSPGDNLVEDDVLIEGYIKVEEGLSQESDQIITHSYKEYRECEGDNFSSATSEGHTITQSLSHTIILIRVEINWNKKSTRNYLSDQFMFFSGVKWSNLQHYEFRQ